MTPSRTIVTLFHLLFLGAAAAGCVYYNTFYNARKRFEEAEQKRQEVEDASGSRRSNTRDVYVYRDLYMKAIRKASIVLDRHADSKWVDDSLLLIGKAFYWRGSYSEALLKFQELQRNFPKSELLEESLYWQGLALWASGKPDEARTVLTQVSETERPEFVAKARLALAELEAEEGNYEAAIEAYQRLQARVTDKGLRIDIWEGIGNARFHLEQFDEALLAYRQILRLGARESIDYRTRLQIGLILERQGRLDEALSEYNRILKIKRLKSFEPEVHLKRANVYRLMGRLDTAVEIYEQVIAQNSRTDESAEAYYRMALIEQKQRKDMERARELFASARKEKPDSDAGKAAREWEQSLQSLERFQKMAEKGDEGSPEALFNMAEIYLFSLGEPDSALAVYRKVLALADTSRPYLAPKALYAIGLVLADSLKNEGAARETFEELIEAHPVSPYAVKARERLSRIRTDDALAEARFLEAEALRSEGAAPEDYLAILEQLHEEYPQSLFAPKALYLLAWTYEHRRASLDTARTYYQLLADRYPLTEFAEVAAEKLKGDYLVSSRADTAASTDTAADTAASVTATPPEVEP